MTGLAYYNEHDAYPAEWLRNLAGAGLIMPGRVDERSIADVRAIELVGYRRVHLFAGIGGWERALQLAGWPVGTPVWTGSCPCQPFSAAGKRGGFDDERHLWPEFLRLVAECRPPTILGEQVASRAGREWLAVVRADLEALGYAVGAADICAASVGAPHIRQRLFFVAHAVPAGRAAWWPGAGNGSAARGGGALDVGDAFGAGLAGRPGLGSDDGEERPPTQRAGDHAGRVAYGDGSGRGRLESLRLWGADVHDADGRGHGDGFWSAVEWLPCRDGKARPAQPGLQPLAHGVLARVGKLRAFGNAIVPQAAAAFVQAFLDVAALDHRSAA